jgi:hypothetical protein
MLQIPKASLQRSEHRPGAASPAAWRSLPALLILVLAGACGQADDQARATDLPADELYNRIEAARVTTAEKKISGPRLDLLASADVPADLRSGKRCTLRQGERLLLLANGAGAIARIDGRPTRLRIGGPVGPSGGFFVADGASVSVGRAVAASGQTIMSEGPATVSVGGANDRPIENIEADWACT